MTRRAFAFAAAFCLAALVGCRQEMANQPRYNPLAPSDFFPDGRSARDAVAGTVPHGSAEAAGADAYERMAPSPNWVADDVGLALGSPVAGAALLQVHTDAAYRFPIAVTQELLDRGRQQFNIYCSVCHDRVGTGRGKIVQRGYLRPPSYHTDRLRQAPLTHFYEVVSDGWGGMPSYSDKLTPDDRWAVIAYVRALQMSQDARAEDLPPEEREKLKAEGGRP